MQNKDGAKKLKEDSNSKGRKKKRNPSGTLWERKERGKSLDHNYK